MQIKWYEILQGMNSRITTVYSKDWIKDFIQNSLKVTGYDQRHLEKAK